MIGIQYRKLFKLASRGALKPRSICTRAMTTCAPGDEHANLNREQQGRAAHHGDVELDVAHEGWHLLVQATVVGHALRQRHVLHLHRREAPAVAMRLRLRFSAGLGPWPRF